ncbi:MAG TPA: hypothetical protein VNJ08_02370 [Bacteriovoracaceae bacterium]|nr:hypothetical protein [Bacteriovoracaceae bacterium]
MKFLTLILALAAFSAFADDGKKDTRYEYKKLEKFDFDEIGVEGEGGSPGDISVSPRLRNEFKNKLPERQNFNKDMKKAIDGLR